MNHIYLSNIENNEEYCNDTISSVPRKLTENEKVILKNSLMSGNTEIVIELINKMDDINDDVIGNGLNPYGTILSYARQNGRKEIVRS